jgi:hypothetical protein
MRASCVASKVPTPLYILGSEKKKRSSNTDDQQPILRLIKMFEHFSISRWWVWNHGFGLMDMVCISKSRWQGARKYKKYDTAKGYKHGEEVQKRRGMAKRYGEEVRRRDTDAKRYQHGEEISQRRGFTSSL